MNYRASIYANPIVGADFYYVKLLNVHLEHGDQSFLWATVLVGPCHGDAAGKRFASIIYRSPKTVDLIGRFRDTFRIEGDDLDAYLDALGRWGCVRIEPAVYEGHEYSAVRYITQNYAMRRLVCSCEQWEENGGIMDWPAGVDLRPDRPRDDIPTLPDCSPDAVESSMKRSGWS